MKKTLLTIAAIALSVSMAFAQDDRLSGIENLPDRQSEVTDDGEFKKADIDLIQYMGYGVHAVKSDAYTSKGFGSGQFYLNILSAYIRPVSWLSLNVGADVAWDYYGSKNKRFELDPSNNIVSRDMTADEKHSSINTTSFLFPGTIRFYAGDWTFRAGAEAILNVRAGVNAELRNGNTRTYIETSKANINRWGYDFVAGLSHDGIGVFVKYMPETVRQFPEPGPSLERWTFGLRLGF